MNFRGDTAQPLTVSKMVPKGFCPLEFTPLCSFLPQRLRGGLCDPHSVAEVTVSGFHLSFGITCSGRSQLPCHEDTQEIHVERAEPSASSQRQLARHVRKPPWKSRLQMTATSANIPAAASPDPMRPKARTAQ